MHICSIAWTSCVVFHLASSLCSAPLGAPSGNFDCFQLLRANIFTCGHWTGHGLCWEPQGCSGGWIVEDLQERHLIWIRITQVALQKGCTHLPNYNRSHLTGKWVSRMPSNLFKTIALIANQTRTQLQVQCHRLFFPRGPPSKMPGRITLNTEGDLTGFLLFRQHLEFQNWLPVHTANFSQKKVKFGGTPLGCGLTQSDLGSSTSPHHTGYYTVQGSI